MNNSDDKHSKIIIRMKRKIQFRGKRADNGEWVFGGFMLNRDEQPCIMAFNPDDTLSMILIEPDTLGQFTGLHDIAQIPIFEDDIVTLGVRDYQDNNTPISEVFWHDELCTYVVDYAAKFQIYMLRDVEPLRIIGNIHDNPEMLKNNDIQ